jgi:NAD(P)-dependent dehydrogenase (short-subunit alcohol dehydrogenase family)
VTGVTVGGAGYHIAQELSLSGGMTVVIMGRSASKLEQAIDSIKAEAVKRGLSAPTLHAVLFDLNDLATAVSAAEEANKIAKQSFGSKIHILVNNAGASVPEYKLTKQNVEANVE